MFCGFADGGGSAAWEGEGGEARRAGLRVCVALGEEVDCKTAVEGLCCGEVGCVYGD